MIAASSRNSLLGLYNRLRYGHSGRQPYSNQPGADLIAQEEISGIKLGVTVRVISLAAINILTIVNMVTVIVWGGQRLDHDTAFYDDPVLWELLEEITHTIPFYMVGLVQYLMARYRPRWRWVLYVTVVIDVIMLPFIVLYPEPFGDPSLPAAIILRTDIFNYYYLMAVVVALTYSPWLSAWLGVVVSVTWYGLALWLSGQPEALRYDDLMFGEGDAIDFLTIFLDPNYVDVGKAFSESVVFTIASMGLAVAVRRARRMVLRGVGAEVQKNNLSRYFSPKVASRLTEMGDAVGQAQRRKVAILFADIVGFTGLTEGKPPEAVLDLLRDFHGRMEAQVFAHDGTLEKYIGDALLATFGTPEPGDHDAADALNCAFAMQRELAAWNAVRASQGLPAVRASIGLHYGEAVMGNIGRDRNMAFVVVGSSVNIASRLQAMGRQLDADIVLSEALATRAEAEDPQARARISGFSRRENQGLRGMQMSVDLRFLPYFDNS